MGSLSGSCWKMCSYKQIRTGGIVCWTGKGACDVCIWRLLLLLFLAEHLEVVITFLCFAFPLALSFSFPFFLFPFSRIGSVPLTYQFGYIHNSAIFDIIVDVHSIQYSWKCEELVVLFEYEAFPQTFWLKIHVNFTDIPYRESYMSWYSIKFFQLLIVNKISYTRHLCFTI